MGLDASEQHGGYQKGVKNQQVKIYCRLPIFYQIIKYQKQEYMRNS